MIGVKMNIREQALNAALPFAHDSSDLIKKALEIEHFLLGGYSRDVKTESANDSQLNESSQEDDASKLLKISKAMIKEAELDYHLDCSNPIIAEHNRELNLIIKSQEQLGALSNKVDKCSDLFTAPVDPINTIIPEMRMENYNPVDIHNNEWKLSPFQLELGKRMRNSNLVINTSRQAGTTSVIAAFAREIQSDYSLKGSHESKLLIITNNYNSVVELYKRIEIASVMVISFDNIFDYRKKVDLSKHHFSHIVIDNAAMIPYANETAIMGAIAECKWNRADSSFKALRERKQCPHDGQTYVSIFSTPALDQGLFYNLFTGNNEYSKITVDGSKRYSEKELSDIRNFIGEEKFETRFCNVFRKAQ
jgi:hypothetical protein